MSQDVRHEHTAYSLHLLYHALDRNGDKCGVDLFVGSFLLVIKQSPSSLASTGDFAADW